MVLLTCASTIGCSGAPQHRPRVQISDFYKSSDTTGYAAFIKSHHFDTRLQIDNVLDSLVIAKSLGDSGRAEVYLEQAEWLALIYQKQAGIRDLTVKYRLYRDWDSAQASRKRYLDSTHAEIGRSKLPLADRVERLREMRQSYDAIGDSTYAASMCYKIAVAFYRDQRIDSARSFLSECILISSCLDVAPLLGDCYYMLGNIYGYHEADYNLSEKNYSKAIEQYRRVGRRSRIYLPLCMLGTILFQLNQTDRALRAFRSALTELGNDGNPYYRGLCACYLGETYYDKGMLDSALFYANESERLRRRIAPKHDQAKYELGYSISLEGLIYHARREFSRARSSYDEADQLFANAGNDEGTCMNLYRMASLAIDQGDFDNARDLYQDVLARTGEGMFEWRVFSIYGLALCDYHFGNINQAIPKLKTCIDLTEKARSGLQSPVVSVGVLTDKVAFYNLLSTIYIQEYMDSDDEALRDSAFLYLERSKTVALVQSMLTPDRSKEFVEHETKYLDRLSRLQSELILHTRIPEEIRRELRQVEDSLFWLSPQTSEAEKPSLPAHESMISLRDLRDNYVAEGCILLEYLLSDFGLK